MIRHYCDLCGVEIKKDQAVLSQTAETRLVSISAANALGQRLRVTLLDHNDAEVKDTDICVFCVFKELKKLVKSTT